MRRPCLVYKVLAAVGKCGTPAEIRSALGFACRNIKATDARSVGLYPRYTDQISEDTRIVREPLG